MRHWPAHLLWALLLAADGAAQVGVSFGSLSSYGNFHAGGVVATVLGDTNRNATAALEWRQGGAFLPGQALVRIDATHFAGSLFGLQPGTAYEVRVTLADPDGVSGPSTATAPLSTRADNLPEPTLRTLYVAPSGNDSNPGTDPGAPLRTIQRAADLAQAGDLVVIRPGVYRESVNLPRSGSASQPIVFRGDAGAILDGADAAIAAGVSWTPAGGGAYSRALGFATGHVVSEAGRLFRYGSLAALQAMGAGAPGGFFFDGSTLFVRFQDQSPPSAHTLQVARLEDGFLVDSRSQIRIEGLEIRHYGAGDYGKGVYLRYASDCVVRWCRIHEVGAAGVWAKGGDRHLIEDNEIWDTSIFGWPWDFTKGSSAENNAVVLTNEVGQGTVIRRNTVHGQFNGIAPCGDTPPVSGVTNETDVYDNLLFQHTDDGFEPEGYCANVRLWGNTLREVHMAFAVAPAGTGPLWILRNVASGIGNTRTSQQDGYTASAIKINSGYPTPVGPLLVFHNTFTTDAPATDAVALLNPGFSSLIRVRNNVIAGTRYSLYKVNPASWDGNGDLLYTSDGTRFVSWEGTRYANLGAFRAGTGQEPNGLSAPPQFVAPAVGDFTPALGSPLIDAGLVLPGINDGYLGLAPDVGAIERPAPAPPAAFYPVTPCRMVDTRNPVGDHGGPALTAGVPRAFGVMNLCGVPASARAVALNLTVTGPTAAGHIRLYPAGPATPLVSAINFGPGATRANNLVVALGAAGGVTALAEPTGTTHLILDVTGYFE
jgi:hypothetical protein